MVRSKEEVLMEAAYNNGFYDGMMAMVKTLVDTAHNLAMQNFVDNPTTLDGWIRAVAYNYVVDLERLDDD